MCEELSNQIVGSFIQVHNELNGDFLESCYHNALFSELKSARLNVYYNALFNVFYRGGAVGEFCADLAVNNKVLIEIKSVRALSPAHEAPLLNYLHISGCCVGCMVYFQGVRAVWKRFAV
ncbi:MAG: GxxExxY protein [Spirochaetales bacterium]|uniref:GxxExxY protein n=1 Tax=Candidatus Thalassospirochaeta sargassi TaxID=3119039 RepID=A0AAJ1MNL6_9SPIO|nr:GxxExxY protein [Spirochaetales bacterium]